MSNLFSSFLCHRRKFNLDHRLRYLGHGSPGSSWGTFFHTQSLSLSHAYTLAHTRTHPYSHTHFLSLSLQFKSHLKNWLRFSRTRKKKKKVSSSMFQEKKFQKLVCWWEFENAICWPRWQELVEAFLLVGSHCTFVLQLPATSVFTVSPCF